MKVRKLAVALALAGGLGSNFSYALGMGEARIDSSLNQPLRAQIELVRPGDVSRDQIQARIASPSDFERAGVQRMGVLRDVQMQVIRNDEGDLVIQVTSDRPIREPFLNFLVELTWPSGRLMREYAFLVDPPDYREAPASSAPAAPTAPARERTAPSPPARETQPEATAERRPEQPDSRAVRGGETLWNIAGEVRPAQDLTREQVMLALQDLNPNAFMGNNINRLRQDAVLRLPSEEEVRRRSPQQARQTVRQQHQAFAERRAAPQDQPVAEAADQAPRSPAEEARMAEAGDELRLVVDDAEATREGSVGGTGIGDGDAELALALEELDRADRERQELSERLAEMESQLETMAQLVQLKDDQMAELQAQLAEAQQQAPPEPEQDQAAPAAAAPEGPGGDTGAADPVTEPQPTLTEQLSSELRNNPYVQVGAGSLGLALLALLLLLARRNSRKEEAAISGAGHDDEDLLDLSESRLGDTPEEATGEAATGATAFASVSSSEEESFDLDEDDEVPLSMDDLERQLKSGDSGSGARDSKPPETEESFDLDWDSDSDDTAGDEEEDASGQALDFSALDTGQEEAGQEETRKEETQEDEKQDDDFDFDLNELDEDEPDSGDDDEESLSFTLDEDFDLSEPDTGGDDSDEDDAPLSDEDLATLGLDDDEPEDEATEESADLNSDRSKTQSGAAFASGDQSTEKEAGSDDEEGDFDDSFLQELDAELDKVTGDDMDEPELGKVAEDMDDLELDLSEDDLALMEDSDETPDPSRTTEDADLDDVPDLSDSELDDTLGEEDLEGDFDLSAEETEALGGDDLEDSLGLEDESLDKQGEADGSSPAADGSSPAADGSQQKADGSQQKADGSDQNAQFDDSLLEEAAGVDLNEDEDEFDFLEGTDESGTKLDLARAYVEMGDADGAREILEEVAAEGSEPQQKEARKLLEEL